MLGSPSLDDLNSSIRAVVVDAVDMMDDSSLLTDRIETFDHVVLDVVARDDDSRFVRDHGAMRKTCIT
jgi:hypothetical protein